MQVLLHIIEFIGNIIYPCLKTVVWTGILLGALPSYSLDYEFLSEQDNAMIKQSAHSNNVRLCDHQLLPCVVSNAIPNRSTVSIFDGSAI